MLSDPSGRHRITSAQRIIVREEKDEHLLQTDTRVETLTGTGTVDFRVPGLTVLWHPDPKRVGELAPLPGLTGGQTAELSRREPSFGGPRISTLRPLADPYVSRKPILLQPQGDGVVRLATSRTVTRLVADGEPVTGERLLSAEEIERGVILLLSNRIVLLLHCMQPFLSHKVPHYGMVGDSASLLRVRSDIEHVSDQSIPLLIRGETGTGKELVAEAVHLAGPRRDGPFIALNMGAIPPSLAAAELFGAARGAFTGADQKRQGYFQKAEGGTLFLDEVGETPPEIQVMLLRALETRAVQPVGSTESLKVDVRLMAATDADLEEAVVEQRFRAPLLHRLSGYEIRLPPMRKRRDDFGRLFLHFLRVELERLGEGERLDPDSQERPWVSASLVARLAAYPWPGNVRQLSNVVRQMVIASRGASTLKPGAQGRQILREVPFVTASGKSRDSRSSDTDTSEWKSDSTAEDLAVLADPPSEDSSPERPIYRSPANIGENELIEALRANRWHLQATAAQLGISRTSLYDLINRTPQLRKASELSREDIEEARESSHGNLDAMVEALEVSQRGLLRRMTELGLR